MTLSLEPTRQLPPAANGQGGLRPLAAGFGHWKAAIFAGFGIFVKKRAFFNESSAQPPLEAQKSAILPTKSGALLARSASSLPREVASLPKEMAPKALLIMPITDLTGSKPDTSDKMAQNVVLQADLTATSTSRMPRGNFVKKLAGAWVTRLKLKEFRDSLHRLLHSLINLKAPYLKTGIQGVGYASNNDSAVWGLLLSGG